MTRPVIAARVEVRAEDWRAAIRVACAPLLEAQAVEPGYVDRCVGLVEESGPYMVLAPGLALAHARPEDGVRTLCLAVTVLDEPVAFGHEENDPVDVVFAFGSPDRDQHVSLLGTLARSLQEGLAEDLRKAHDAEKAENLLAGVLDELDDR